MLRRAPLALAFVLLFVLAAPRPAEAARIRLGLGANYWFAKRGLFTATVGGDFGITRSISAGLRGGGLLLTDPAQGGIPTDLLVRFHVSSAMAVELLGGPWFFFEGQGVRAHVGAALVVSAGSASLGFELGYLQPDPILGMSLAFRF